MSENECTKCCPFHTLFCWLWGVGSMNTAKGWALAPLRLAMFAMFITPGWDKLLHFDRAMGAASGAHFPTFIVPVMAACLVFAELGGSILMLIGVGVRLAAFLQGFVIVVILSTVKSDIAFTSDARMFHLALAICIALLILGNGRPTILHGRPKKESCENES